MRHSSRSGSYSAGSSDAGAMDPLHEAARRSPDAPAVLDGGGDALTYGGLERRVGRIARGLLRSGLEPGDLVAAALPWSADSVALLHAIWRIGGAVLPVNLAWTGPERRSGIAAAGGVARVIDSERAVAALAGRAVADGRARVSGPAPGAPESLAARVLTSGSTGAPRAVPVSHGNLRASASAVTERLGLLPADRWLTSLSLAHIGGLAMLHRAAVVGCALVTERKFDAGRLACRISAGEITHAALVPVMLSRLLDGHPSLASSRSLRCLLVGGAPLPAPLLRRALERGLPVALTYGLTEATSQVATMPPVRVMAKPGSVGRPLSGVEVRIQPAGPGGSGTGAGRDGEIWVRGRTVPRELCVDGWLRTGDLGRRDGEGDLWVTGRISERIITGGVTVSPAEVESVLLGHAAVREVAVFGVPDSEWGERIVALVVPEDPARPPDLPTLLRHASPRLAPAKRPREVRVAAAIPRTPTGKPDRTRLAGP